MEHKSKEDNSDKKQISPLKYSRKRLLSSSHLQHYIPNIIYSPPMPIKPLLTPDTQENTSFNAATPRNKIVRKEFGNFGIMGNKKRPGREKHKEASELDLLSQIVKKRYLIQKKIGSGSFGTVFRGYDLIRKCHVSIKSEPIILKEGSTASQLTNECKAYNTIRNYYKVHISDKDSRNGISSKHYPFPQVYYFGRFKGYNILVLELLGPNLEDVFNLVGRKFSTKTTFMLALQFLGALELLHGAGLVHRDLKPANFLLARPRTNKTKVYNEGVPAVYCIDLGLCRYWKIDDKHIEKRRTGSMSGTARYASINNHSGFTQSRRDDLESLANTLVYFARGKLEWMGLRRKGNLPAHEVIGEKKKSMVPEEICKGLENEFLILYNYSRCLGFKEDPDYSFLNGVFRKGLVSKGYLNDQIYDWQKFNISKYLSRPLPSKSSQQRASSYNINRDPFSLSFSKIYPRHCNIEQPNKRTDNRLTSEVNPLFSLVRTYGTRESSINFVGESDEETKVSKVDSIDVLVDANSRVSVFDMKQKIKDYKDVQKCTEVDHRLKESFTNETMRTKVATEVSEFAKSISPVNSKSQSGDVGSPGQGINRRKKNKKKNAGCLGNKCSIF
eukprot:GAHX01000441.1.p1 GENE.GAHX01000441.1~~GAHX01000441.1.p1  ORF type:complete len:614 (-),score=106.84 GAHX01000441.1:1710-3551(-)